MASLACHFFRCTVLLYALLPIHTTNLQKRLTGWGAAIFLKLELIKRHGICFMLFSAFVFKNVYLMISFLYGNRGHFYFCKCLA